MDPMSRYILSTTHPTPAAQLTPDCLFSDFSGLSVLPDTSPEPHIHSPTIPEDFEIFHFFHDFDPPGMVSDDSESMVPLGNHLTSPVKILTRSLIIHGHVSKLENFHTLLKILFPHPPVCTPTRDRLVALAQSHFSIPSSQSVGRISAHWSAFFLDIIPRHFQAVMNHLCAQRHMRWNIRAARDNSPYPRPRSKIPIKPPSNSRRIISWNINGLVSKRNDLREHISEHPANGPGKRGIALGFLVVLPAREIEGVPGTLILAKVPGLTEQQVWTVGSIYLGKNDRQATLKLVERALELATRDHNPQIIIGGDWNAPHATLQRKVSSWGFGLHVVSFPGSKATFRGRTATARWSSIDHFVYTPVPVQHRRLYRATTKKAICGAKNAYRAWLASRDSILSPQETIQGKYNQYILAEATASRLTKQDDRLRWRSHCTRIDNLLAGGCAKQAWNAAKRMACASGSLL
ncbi:hypothetical protein BASA81_016419 [Batrachochytrium salamandrivorans]|nr:hypothetical protein BASA81_016419 [Batrachochytrium salamandrivorans]